MKKTYLLILALFALVFTACEPLEDVQDEINAELDNELAVGNIDYTLTEDDYDDLGLNFPNFGSQEEARTLIPSLLADLYPTYGAGSSINVSYAIYDPLTVEDYMVTSADYAAGGFDGDYFSDLDGVADFLTDKFETAANGAYVRATYNIVATEIEYTLSDADFDLIGEELSATYPAPASSAAQYGNFERREERDAYWTNDMILEALNVVLSDQFDDVEGQLYTVTYDIYDGSSGSEVMTVKFDGNTYVAVGGTAYTLDNDDFDFIGDEFADEYPGPAANADQFNSFDVRESSANYWSEDMLIEAIGAILIENFPSAAEGAQFDVSFAVYNGSVTTFIRSVVLSEGIYVIDDSVSISTIEETTVFAKVDGDFQEPFILPANSYQEEFGQRFGNFDDEDEAARLIGIYLSNQFPYAEEGDLIPVAYKFYNGSATVTNYANFVYTDGNFELVPTVRTESLKFGYDNGMFVPDNTIRYRFLGGDYSLVSSTFADVYPGPAGNVGQFGSFDVRSSSGNYWNPDMLLEAVNVVLDNLDPSAQEGQKYVVTFAAYNGSVVDMELSVIKTGGEWILNE
ncbi:hypothetical protein [Gramella sp. AN32]|uniref:DUF5017 domain-containing protein n=1 Tax=Christiangramia antarctica TaxID=2058158 RepID=A0ABW5X1E2_9FLAO|nr:hypothetical protein [Gramella sp. AN32]MCM4155134.1 hypothetical protein [Gramella sp. AN32]